MIPVYRRKDNFFHELHPASMLMLAAALMLLSLLADNPLCQVAIILSTAVLAWSAGVFKAWASLWKVCFAVFIMSAVINTLISSNGLTIIWRGPSVPVLGRIQLTAEALAYGTGMGLRLAAVILIFALLTVVVDPDSVLGLLKGRGLKSALVSALSMRMVPTMVRDASDLLDAQRSRGVVRDGDGKLAAVRSRLPLIRRMFSTSLDRGIGLAEAMESRAYGSGIRTRYRKYGIGPGDVSVLAASLLLLTDAVAVPATGALSFKYYPSISFVAEPTFPLYLLAPLIIALALGAISWLWKRSNWLKLKT
jgi:energy-coupling factor transport system permease protein